MLAESKFTTTLGTQFLLNLTYALWVDYKITLLLSARKTLTMCSAAFRICVHMCI